MLTCCLAFAIFTSSRTFTLAAPTESTAQEWIKALLQASNLSTHRCEEELGLQALESPLLLSSQPKPRSRTSLPPLDTSIPSTHTNPNPNPSVPFTGLSPSSARRTSLDGQRVASFDSSGGYFSGAELSASPLDGVTSNPVVVGPSSIPPQAPEISLPGRQSYETDELEGLAEDRVVAQGYLLCLKNVSGVRQWKRRWVVLRGRSLTLYKNFEVPPHFTVYPGLLGIGG